MKTRKNTLEELDDLKESRGYSNLKEEALDRAMWRFRFGRGFGPVVRQTINEMKCFPQQAGLRCAQVSLETAFTICTFGAIAKL
jgi:hypothetical protein